MVLYFYVGFVEWVVNIYFGILILNILMVEIIEILFYKNFIKGGICVEDGFVYVLIESGFGIEVDEDFVRVYFFNGYDLYLNM